MQYVTVYWCVAESVLHINLQNLSLCQKQTKRQKRKKKKARFNIVKEQKNDILAPKTIHTLSVTQ